MQYVHFMALSRWVGALSSVPFAWARGWFQRQASFCRRAMVWNDRPPLNTGPGAFDAARAWQTQGLAAGFDLARAQYAAGVHAGLIERSLLASGAFERRLGVLERLTLGPWARRV